MFVYNLLLCVYFVFFLLGLRRLSHQGDIYIYAADLLLLLISLLFLVHCLLLQFKAVSEPFSSECILLIYFWIAAFNSLLHEVQQQHLLLLLLLLLLVLLLL